MSQQTHDVSKADFEALGPEGQALIGSIRDGWQFDSSTEVQSALYYARQADLVDELRRRVDEEGATQHKDGRSYVHPALSMIHTLTQAITGYLSTFVVADKPKPMTQKSLHAQHAAKMRWAGVKERSA